MNKVAVFSSKPYDREFLSEASKNTTISFHFFEDGLSMAFADIVKDFDAVCLFVNDKADRAILEKFIEQDIRFIALRCAGFNNVDLAAAKELGVTVARVPAYSPYAVAEHALAMIMTLNRKTHRSFNRVRESNFSLNGLIGFDLHGKTVGVVGTGKIGQIFCGIMQGLGCKVIAYDPFPNEKLIESGVVYSDLESLFQQSDIISLQCPLTSNTHHLIDEHAIASMKDGVMLINTSRGGLIDTKALTVGLKHGKIGYLGLDVYEQEENLFFNDLSGQIIQDDLIMRLTTFPNVLITAHQAFFTENALKNIAETTVKNLTEFFDGKQVEHEITV